MKRTGVLIVDSHVTPLRRGTVGMTIGIARVMPIGELFNSKRQRKLERHLSKVYAKAALKTKFSCKRCEVSSILPPVLGELRTAISDHVWELHWKRAEEIRASKN